MPTSALLSISVGVMHTENRFDCYFVSFHFSHCLLNRKWQTLNGKMFTFCFVPSTDQLVATRRCGRDSALLREDSLCRIEGEHVGKDEEKLSPPAFGASHYDTLAVKVIWK